jgi:3-keto-disaccharide hydrolase
MLVRLDSMLRRRGAGALIFGIELMVGWLISTNGEAAQPNKSESGFVSLTGRDGREHWLGYGRDKEKETWPPTWEFADGVLHTKGGGGDLKTRDEYGDFDLRFEWKVSPGANSGVMYRVSQETDPAYHTGPEYQIVDNLKHKDGANPLTSAASAYALYAPNKDLTKPAGSWNESRILVKGNHVEHYLNGKKVVEYDLASDDWNKRLAASKFTEWKKFGTNRRGHVVLQDHGDEVWYRNVRIKNLDRKSNRD